MWFCHTIDAGMRNHPGELEQVVELGAGRFVLRPLRRGDRSAYEEFIARIDASDLRRRFFHPSDMPPELILSVA